MTVIIVALMSTSIARASSAVPWNASGELASTSTYDSAAPAASATTAQTAGTSQSAPRAPSPRASRVSIVPPPGDTHPEAQNIAFGRVQLAGADSRLCAGVRGSERAPGVALPA